MATATASRTNAATPTTGRSRKTPSPVAAKETAPVPVPRQPRAKKNGDHKKKDSKVVLHAHYLPGKAAIATMTPDLLNELAFVSTYNSRDEQSSHPRKRGYQREPISARYPGIGKYYAKGDNRNRIPNLIVNVRVYSPEDQVKFNQLFVKGDMKALHREFGKHVFSIIDGQHRKGGLFYQWNTDEEFNADVPITLYYGLHYAEEAQLFDDINTTQRKLAKALIEATKVHMEAGSKSHEQFIREVASAVAEDGDSVWKGLINMSGDPKEKDKPLTFESIRRSTGNMLPVNLVTRLQARKMRVDKVAKRYWELVASTNAAAWEGRPKEGFDEDNVIIEEDVKYKIHDLAGTGALARLGQDILGTSLEKGETEEEFWSSVADLVSRLSAVDWEKRRDNPWVVTGAGFAGANDLYKLLFQLVYLDKEPGEAVEPDDQ